MVIQRASGLKNSLPVGWKLIPEVKIIKGVHASHGWHEQWKITESNDRTKQTTSIITIYIIVIDMLGIVTH